MAYEFFYPGASYSLDPGYGNFTGYRSPVSSLAITTDPRTANQVKETSDKLNMGLKKIEVEGVSAEIFESIPEQHLDEIKRLSKLTGAKASVHGPIIEPSGFTRQGWSEENRRAAERQMQSALERSHKVDPDGNIPVTFHSSGILPGSVTEMVDEGGKRREEEKQLLLVNKDTKQIRAAEKETKYEPEKGKEEVVRSAREQINDINNTEWVNKISNLNFYNKEASEKIAGAYGILGPLILKQNSGEKISEQELQNPEVQQAINSIWNGQIFLQNSEASFRELYDKAYRYGDKETQEGLNKIAEQWKENSRKMELKRKEIEKLKQEGQPPELQVADLIHKKFSLMNQTLNQLRNVPAPELYETVEDFSKQNSAKTFANIAFNSYKKFGNKSPIVSIENPPAGGALSKGGEIRDLVIQARKEFVDRAVENGYDKGKAKKAAERLIGATWDVGHINMLRKYGYTDKDIIKETEKVSPYVKHVHLSDNFGFEHTELPMGMGNVPTKEMLEEIEKKGFKGRKVIEAAQWFQHFKTSPIAPSLEAFGSPIYGMQMAPYWNQAVGTFGDYFSGYGATLPEQHFSMYGSGFTSLPTELGGQMPGRQDRFSGAPNQ
jgi:hypothetical protein